MQIENAIIGGLKISGYNTDYIFQTIKQSNNFYEIELLKKWTPLFDKAEYIFDIGANLGNHSVYWATNLNYKKNYSFEPFKPNFKLLQENINNNHLKNIVLINKGVSSKHGFTTIKSFNEKNYGNTVLSEETTKKSYDIELIDLDTFIFEENIPMIDFIKIDTEGFELKILNGSHRMLELFYPDLWIEVTSNSFYDIWEKLKQFDYILYDADGSNLLFLSKKRHTNLLELSKKIILKKMIFYYETTTLYYNNYITAKEWFLNKKNEIQHYIEANQLANEKYKKITSDYQKSKDNFLKTEEKYALLSREKQQEKNTMENNLIFLQENFKKTKQEYIFTLQDIYQDYEEMIFLLEELTQNVRHLETQNNYLKNENSQYQKKLVLITESWWGKCGIKLYKKIQRIKFLFQK